MEWFWYLTIYSFIGFLLEIIFARITRQEKKDRKCFYLLPLCPVYGWGALGILSLPEEIKRNILLLVVAGGAAATMAEYAVSLWDEKVLGVHFWNYSELSGNMNGRICWMFSAAWGVLSVVLVYVVHPALEEWVAGLPVWLVPAVAVLVIGDGTYSALLLRRTGTTEALKWYA